jgi:hypothetical protein
VSDERRQRTIDAMLEEANELAKTCIVTGNGTITGYGLTLYIDGKPVPVRLQDLRLPRLRR